MAIPPALVADNPTLLFCPAVGAWRLEDGIFFDRKFYDGLCTYAAVWPGRLRLVVRTMTSPPPQFGLRPYDETDFPADLHLLEPGGLVGAAHLAGADAVLASGDEVRNLHLAALCRQHRIKCIYDIEYILETRLQIAAIDRAEPWQRVKTFTWLGLKELARRKAFRLADGLQANGVPAYEAYAPLVPNALLYFDSRIRPGLAIDRAALVARLAGLARHAPLRLGFSGRLVAIKGADHLVELARALQARRLAFSMDIFGAGDLAPRMQAAIAASGLASVVRMHGAVDFAAELIPFMKAKIDIFVCCHRQSDPSCTYLETYACGVPIAGYANRAHAGILARHDVGWSVAMDDVAGLAELIARLDGERDEIEAKSFAAAAFAHGHAFEPTFARRMAHCLAVLQAPGKRKYTPEGRPIR